MSGLYSSGFAFTAALLLRCPLLSLLKAKAVFHFFEIAQIQCMISVLTELLVSCKEFHRCAL